LFRDARSGKHTNGNGAWRGDDGGAPDELVSEKVLRTVVTFVVVFVVLMSHDAGGLTVGEGRKNG
jgi:hypothetical protein